MATNPQIPPDRRHPVDDHAKVVLTKQGRPWWPVLILIVAAAILAALIFWLPRAPRKEAPPTAAQVPPQATGAQVQLTQLNASGRTPGGAMNLRGNLVNNGSTEIVGVTVEAKFRNDQGQILNTMIAEMQGLDPRTGERVAFTQDPVPPGSTRPFEIRLERVPQDWNGSLPELRVTQVRATGQ